MIEGTNSHGYNNVIQGYNNMSKKRKDFESYPTRSFTCSDEVWNKLKMEKMKSEMTWTNFLKDLLSKYKK